MNLNDYITNYKTYSNSQFNKFMGIYNNLNFYKKEVFNYILDKNRHQKHRLHVVSPSPWPIYSAACAFLFVLGMVQWMHGYSALPLICGIIALISAFVFWFRDIIREGVYMGYHTKIINSCLRFGFILFLVSEVMFFFGFFWSLLHYTLTPSIFAGGIWPPHGIVLYLMSENVNYPTGLNKLIKAQVPMLIDENHYVRSAFFQDEFCLDKTILNYFPISKPTKPFWLSIDYYHRLDQDFYDYALAKNAKKDKNIWGFHNTTVYINLHCHGVLINPYKIPLLNTAILVTSGFILTLAHSYLRIEWYRPCYRLMIGTILFGLYFITLQAYEYTYSGFSMNDGVYGSIFYMLTGFHGFHVIIGTIFLIVCTFRLRLSHFTSNNHFAFEAAAWYWHFVDVVWILLYLLLYLWPNAKYFNKSASIYFDGNSRSIFINMSSYFYINICNKDPNFVLPTGINFEFSPNRKLKVVKDIMNFFSKKIITYEHKHFLYFQLWTSVEKMRLLTKLKP